MSDELSNATRIAALEEQVRMLQTERDEYRDSLAVTTTDNNATFDGINAALDAAGITFMGVDTYAACIGRLAAERDERNAYAERLLAENVRLSNEAAEIREDLANAQTWIGGQDTFSDFRNAGEMRWALVQEREKSASLSRSITAACTGSGCVNAHELRAALDASTARESAYRADVVRLTAEREEWRKINGNQSILVMLTEAELDRERERCGVLELALQAAAGKFKHIAENWGNSGDACALSDAVSEMQMEASQAETDTRHALDAAKFVGGG